MRISTHWLQKYFAEPLPHTEALSDAFTFHAFEIDGVEEKNGDAIFDVKITANRGHDCLSYRGIAKELSAILNIPLLSDPLATPPTLTPTTSDVSVHIDTPLCKRYVAGYVRGVKVGPSPQWLIERLEAMGQRSINNVVDATNFVMFNLGQPLHAFDAGKLTNKNGYAIAVRMATEGEHITALDLKDYTLSPSMMVISDAHTNTPIGIAGVKGGVPAAITEDTKDIILESANFDGVSVRRTASALRLRTDASARFEQGIVPDMAGYGMASVVELIQKLAGGELMGFVDMYPALHTNPPVSITLEKIQAVLGSTFTKEHISDAFTRLGFAFTFDGGVFTVTPPFERLDLTLPEDLLEEVVRIIGYDAVPSVALPPASVPASVNKTFFYTEKIREFLTNNGFSEVFTTVFSVSGERGIANNINSDRPFLRSSLVVEVTSVLEKNVRLKEYLNVPQVRVFEIGYVWAHGAETLVLALGVESVKKQPTTAHFMQLLGEHLGTVFPENASPVVEVVLAPVIQALPEVSTYEVLPVSSTERYQPFSRFPYMVRDIALFIPSNMSSDDIEQIIAEKGSMLLVKQFLFDRFEKEGKVSLAFRLVFQSSERTLVEQEVQTLMENISNTLIEKGCVIR